MIGFLLCLSIALADSIGPDPEDCPRGAIGTSSHEGEWCTPDECPASGCAEGKVCGQQKLCVERATWKCGGLGGFEEECTVNVQVVHGTCDDGTCTKGTCEERAVCVPKDAPPPGQEGSAWCATTVLPVSLGISLLLLGTVRRED